MSALSDPHTPLIKLMEMTHPDSWKCISPSKTPKHLMLFQIPATMWSGKRGHTPTRISHRASSVSYHMWKLTIHWRFIYLSMIQILLKSFPNIAILKLAAFVSLRMSAMLPAVLWWVILSAATQMSVTEAQSTGYKGWVQQESVTASTWHEYQQYDIHMWPSE